MFEGNELLRATAFFAAQSFPEYFGTFSVLLFCEI